jgi:hypothetical protein
MNVWFHERGCNKVALGIQFILLGGGGVRLGGDARKTAVADIESVQPISALQTCVHYGIQLCRHGISGKWLKSAYGFSKR